MIEKLKSIIQEYLRLSELAIDPETLGNQQESIKINKQISDMQEKYELAKEYLNYHGQLEEAKEILNAESDEDMLEIAKEQKKESEAKLEELEQQIKIALLPSDPNDDKNIFLEIRPAA
jgi:peptide chain release factor 1